MYQRDPRSYTYEDHSAFPSGTYAAANYTHQDGSSQFYAAQTHTAPMQDMAVPSDGVLQ